MQKGHNSIANALELCLFCIKPSISLKHLCIVIEYLGLFVRARLVKLWLQHKLIKSGMFGWDEQILCATYAINVMDKGNLNTGRFTWI